MRKSILLFYVLLMGISAACAQSGTWSGALEVRGNRLPLVFHFDDNKPTMDSPAQSARDIPIQVSRGDDSSITVSIPYAGASFEGKVGADRIEGTFKQHGFAFPLTLTPGEERPNRPQTPTGKGPYTEEEATFTNGSATLKGTLTLPEGYSRQTPVLVMVTGSGLQNRDEEAFGHKPFAVLADALARKGITTLRYDDRGFGESTGDAANCTTEDLMLDALAGIDLMRQRFDNVGVLGHSEGGTIALMLAADKKADFIVSLAGMVISGKETLLDQNRRALAEAGVPEQTVAEYCRLLELLFDNDENFEKQFAAAELPAALRQNMESVAGLMKMPYHRYFVALDLRKRLADISCPVLALNGTKDTQVSYVANLDALKQGLPAGSGNKIHAAEGLNHLFQHCNTGAVTEYAQIEETMSPQILDMISSWINSLHNAK